MNTKSINGLEESGGLMIKVTELETSGWKAAVRGLRNPKESWGKSDSGFVNGVYVIGQNDLKLMRTLIKSGSCERKFLRMIDVVCDIEAPLYWWKEFDTYKVGTVANSCSTMHTITEHPITMDLFSHDRLTEDAEGLMEQYIAIIEFYRQLYLDKGGCKILEQCYPDASIFLDAEKNSQIQL